MPSLTYIAPQPSTEPTQGAPSGRQAASSNNGSDSSGEPWIVQYVMDASRWGNSPADFKPADIQLPKDPQALPSAMNRALESAYISHGLNGIDRFAVGVFGLDNYTNLVLRSAKRRFGAFPKTGDRLFALLKGAIPSDREELWAAFEVAYKAIKQRRDAVRIRIEKAAQLRLIYRELPRSRLEVLRETRRYLSLREDKDTAALQILQGGPSAAHTELLLGPDGRNLIAALAKVIPLAKSVSEAENTAVGQGLKNWTGKAMALAGPLPARVLGVLIQPSEEQLSQSAGSLATARGSYAAGLATWGAGFPALYRLVDSESNAEDEVRIALDVTQFLQEAWAASWDAAKNFRDHPEDVWTLPILIDQTVACGFVPKRDFVAGLAAEPSQVDDDTADSFDHETSFAERVAADELIRISKDVPAIEVVNNILQFIDLVATPAKVEVPLITLVIEILTLVAGVAELADSYVRSEPQRLVSRAAFGPGRSVSSAAPYLSTIVKAIAKAIFLLPATAKK